MYTQFDTDTDDIADDIRFEESPVNLDSDSKTYYIITDVNNKVAGTDIVIHPGLNIIDEFYKSVKNFRFFNRKGIHDFYNLGVILYELRLPSDTLDLPCKLYFKCCHKSSYIIPDSKTYTSNAFIIGKKYDLRHLQTLKILGLDYFSFKLCKWCAKYKLLDVLDMIHAKHSIVKFLDRDKYFKSILYSAIINNNIEVLDWFKRHYRPVNEYVIARATQLASILERIEILDWFAKSGYTFEYDEKLILELLKNHKMNALKWYIAHNCPLNYIDRYDTEILTAFDDFLIHGDIDLLDTWINHYGKRYAHYTERGCDFLIKHNKTDVIEWMHKNGLKLITNKK
jgi:hypothetical protein